jgi:hypothetical protein
LVGDQCFIPVIFIIINLLARYIDTDFVNGYKNNGQLTPGTKKGSVEESTEPFPTNMKLPNFWMLPVTECSY